MLLEQVFRFDPGLLSYTACFEPFRYGNILDLILSSEENMVEDLFVLEHLANSDHNVITWKTTCETVINKNFR